MQRWQQIHDLPDAGVGLLECARRLDLALNTVKRYARIDKPEQMRRAPQYGASPWGTDIRSEVIRKMCQGSRGLVGSSIPRQLIGLREVDKQRPRSARQRIASSGSGGVAGAAWE